MKTIQGSKELPHFLEISTLAFKYGKILMKKWKIGSAIYHIKHFSSFKRETVHAMLQAKSDPHQDLRAQY